MDLPRAGAREGRPQMPSLAPTRASRPVETPRAARGAPQDREAHAGELRSARRLATYAAADGPRELLALPRPHGTLLLDCAAGSPGDRRLVGLIAPEEPPQNLVLLCRLYLADPTRGRCRRLTAADLIPAAAPNPAQGACPDAPLVDARGRVYRIERVPDSPRGVELRWTCSPAADASCGLLPLRDVVGALEDYEPARSITVRALAQGSDAPRLSTAYLRAELARLDGSPIVLNRGLREAVLRHLKHGLSMSEIAIRCGRTKLDRRGNLSGETSWLQRRIGLLAEGGCPEPTPWVHSEVLALIARRGLAIAPAEVEL